MFVLVLLSLHTSHSVGLLSGEGVFCTELCDLVRACFNSTFMFVTVGSVFPLDGLVNLYFVLESFVVIFPPILWHLY